MDSGFVRSTYYDRCYAIIVIRENGSLNTKYTEIRKRVTLF